MGLDDWDYEGKGLWRSEQRVVFWQTSIKPQVLLEQQLLLVIKKKKKSYVVFKAIGSKQVATSRAGKLSYRGTAENFL